MTFARALALAAGVLAALAVLACGDEGTPRVVVEGGGEFTVTPTETTEPSDAGPTATSTAEAEPTATPVAPTPAGGTATPSSTPRFGTVTPGTQGSDNPSDLAGSPHSTASVRSAVEAAGYEFRPVEVDTLCTRTSVPELRFWAAEADDRVGPVYSLWVYPDAEALHEDWSVGSGSISPRTAGCSLPTGFVYWNANAVLAFNTWVEGEDDLGPFGYDSSPRNYRTIDAFLDLAR